MICYIYGAFIRILTIYRFFFLLHINTINTPDTLQCMHYTHSAQQNCCLSFTLMQKETKSNAPTLKLCKESKKIRKRIQKKRFMKITNIIEMVRDAT